MFDIATIYKKQVEAIDTQIKDEMMRIAITWGIDINEEQLVKAITDARSFYDKGYADGEADAKAAWVRCKDCKFWDCYGGEESHKGDCLELELDCCMYEDDFCSYGERKETEVKET